MKYRIGLDFDNTIACYDSVFTQVARDMGLISGSSALIKAEVKRLIHVNSDGDENWQRLQGQIYGKYMYLASIFTGFSEFLSFAKLSGHEVFIVSHKSPYGHFDENKIPLREEAMKWLLANKFVGDGQLTIPLENVFFETTRREKIERIKSLGCTHFIDDLQEVFDEESFPNSTAKYLFDPAGESNSAGGQFEGSWRVIGKEILGDWTEEQVEVVVRHIFPEVNILKAHLIKGRGNSRIYKLEGANALSYALKVYPDRQVDMRNRLETEFLACNLLSDKGFPVVNSIDRDNDMNWAIYSWVEGEIEVPDGQFVDIALNFVNRLKVLSGVVKANEFQHASEACLSGSEILRQIEERLDRLKGVDNSLLQSFLNTEFIPIFNSSTKLARIETGKAFDEPIHISQQILSPSDFGSHNAIKNRSGETVFIDFEYFGWDDPVKLACDFYWHPAMNLTPNLKIKWIEEIKAIFANNVEFDIRFQAYMPLIGLRWCLIVLNEFLPSKLAQRIHADQQKADNASLAKEAQLRKASDILSILKTNTKLWTNVPSF